MIRKKGNITPFEAAEKIRKWCAFSERSQQETRIKLREYGLDPEQVEGILADLIVEGFLNEERFARAYVRGKFRMKHWGKMKIKQGLREHRVTENCIAEALKEVDPDEYERSIRNLIEKKLLSLKDIDKRKRYHSTLSYMLSKGYETEFIIHNLHIILGIKEEAI